VLIASITIALMIEAVSTSETSANLYEAIRRNTTEGSLLHTHRRKNLKSRLQLNTSVAVW
jgi:hypothetical protein